MIRASDEAPPDQNPKDTKAHAPILSKEEIFGNSFILFFAGHETSANSIHFSLCYLAIHLSIQQHMQADIDSIVGSKPSSEFSYSEDMPRLYNSMVGAVMNEQMRLMPALLAIPKDARGEQTVVVKGRDVRLPSGTYVNLNVPGTNRNPRFWPHSPSKITPGIDDLGDFVPERWFPSSVSAGEKTDGAIDGVETTSFDTAGKGSLFKPVKGSYISFSEGARACPGRRFAQVEVTAVLAGIFQTYSVELDVAEWASDEELQRMGSEEKRELYEKAVQKARGVLARCEQRRITLQMVGDDCVPVKFVKRGGERFAGVYSSA